MNKQTTRWTRKEIESIKTGDLLPCKNKSTKKPIRIAFKDFDNTGRFFVSFYQKINKSQEIERCIKEGDINWY